MRLFIGIEAEGRFKGLRTLFVAQNWFSGEHLKLIDVALGQNIAHVYLGASRLWVTDWVDAIDFVSKCRANNLIVTLEHPLVRAHEIPAILYRQARIILSIDQVCAGLFAHSDVEIKVQDDKTALLYDHPEIVSLDYLGDREIEL